ncbi:MAG TPA: translation elongation factor Ts [Pseudomonadales bacterium]|nr:translation elongation factor Ts [Pseudomonadales bacterium]
MAVTAAMVKELRELTGLGMMDCKKALTESDGDMNLAIESLRRNSAVKAAKKADRTASEGLLGVRVADDGSYAVLVEVNIETDFAARDESFAAFVRRVRDVAFEKRTSDLAALLAGGLDAEREKLVQSIGENVSVRRIALLEAADGKVASYLHADNRKAALVALVGGDDELGRDVAMHVTASKPMVVAGADVAPDIVETEREIYAAQAQDSGKPADIIAKIVEGRVRKFLAEVSLLEQPFVKDPNTRVGQLLNQKKARCTGFVRYEVGEGIDKLETDFAAEVAARVRGKG